MLFWLWPEEGQWPREKRGRWERAGMNCSDWVNIGNGNDAYWLSGGLHKGHDIDVDQLWSDRDLLQYLGLQKNGVLPELHANRLDRGIGVGNRLGGLALHCMLTGDPKAKEACLRNGAGLVDAWSVLSKSKSPPVFMPNNSSWHSAAGSLMRTGHLLQYGWWQKSR